MQSSEFQRAKRRASRAAAEKLAAAEKPAMAETVRPAAQAEQPAAGSPPPRPAAHRKHGRGVAVVGIIAAAIAVAALVFALARTFGGNGAYDSAAVDGQAPYKTAEEIQEELDRTVRDGMFNISIVSSIDFDDALAPGKAYIENVPANKYCMRVVITEDATSDVLYESGVLRPNQYIEDIYLDKELSPGTHQATATFKALDAETLDEMGETAAQIALVIKR